MKTLYDWHDFLKDHGALNAIRSFHTYILHDFSFGSPNVLHVAGWCEEAARGGGEQDLQGVRQGALPGGAAGGREVVVVQALLPLRGVQQAPHPRHLRQPPGRHLLQGAPQGALHAQGGGEGLHGGTHEEEEKC